MVEAVHLPVNLVHDQALAVNIRLNYDAVVTETGYDGLAGEVRFGAHDLKLAGANS